MDKSIGKRVLGSWKLDLHIIPIDYEILLDFHERFLVITGETPQNIVSLTCSIAWPQ